MPKRNATAQWKGSLKEGRGVVKLESGCYEGPYTFAARFEKEEGTNPEEWIAAAHSGCFSMFSFNERSIWRGSASKVRKNFFSMTV